MKKLLCILLSVIGIFSMFTMSVAAAEIKFADVPDNAWYAEAVYRLVEDGVINGFEDNTFRPNDTLTVDQLIKMVVIATGNQLEQGIKYWAQPYIDFAIDKGIVLQGEFIYYKRPITRGEIARILVRCMKDEIYPDNYNMYQSLIKDFGTSSEAYREYILKAFVAGMMEGYPDATFGANKNLTRAEAATVVLRLTDKAIRKIPVLPAQTGNEGFIEPDLRVIYYNQIGYSYYFTINLANYMQYKDRGYKVKVECINYPELNSRYIVWFEKYQISPFNVFRDIDGIVGRNGDIYELYGVWRLDPYDKIFEFHVGMTTRFKITVDNGKGVTNTYYLEGTVQDRRF